MAKFNIEVELDWMKIIDWWFKEVKDLLDDGKVNGSQN